MGLRKSPLGLIGAARLPPSETTMSSVRA